MGYTNLVLTEEEISAGSYKSRLGGGAERWAARGKAQLDFLVEMGMTRNARLLDIGCGPARLGVHCIRFLEAGNYFGFDDNRSLVAAAHHVVEAEDLNAKMPTIEAVDDFKVAGRFSEMDFGLAFSVLNHCTEAQRAAFFANIAGAFRKTATIFITHAWWFDPSHLANSPLQVARSMGQKDLTCFDEGWDIGKPDTGLFPILELHLA